MVQACKSSFQNLALLVIYRFGLSILILDELARKLVKIKSQAKDLDPVLLCLRGDSVGLGGWVISTERRGFGGMYLCSTFSPAA
jgi:hypothetical protein